MVRERRRVPDVSLWAGLHRPDYTMADGSDWVGVMGRKAGRKRRLCVDVSQKRRMSDTTRVT